jgi:hypothetical protein
MVSTISFFGMSCFVGRLACRVFLLDWYIGPEMDEVLMLTSLGCWCAPFEAICFSAIARQVYYPFISLDIL